MRCDFGASSSAEAGPCGDKPRSVGIARASQAAEYRTRTAIAAGRASRGWQAAGVPRALCCADLAVETFPHLGERNLNRTPHSRWQVLLIVRPRGGMHLEIPPYNKCDEICGNVFSRFA